MTTQPVSGCGPGKPYPPDTQCDGSRSVRKTTEDRQISFGDLMLNVRSVLSMGWENFSPDTLASLFQSAADLAGQIAARESSRVYKSIDTTEPKA